MVAGTSDKRGQYDLEPPMMFSIPGRSYSTLNVLDFPASFACESLQTACLGEII
jgi:hypothetical protein